MEDTDYLKRLTLNTLKTLSDALLIAEDEGQLSESGKALSQTISDIISKKEKEKNDVMEMDFLEYKEYLKRKEEERVFNAKLNEAKRELNVWEFLVNIRQHIKNSSSITRLGQLGHHANSEKVVLQMKNGEEYNLEVNKFSHTTPIMTSAFILDYKSKDDTLFQGSISFKSLQDDNPLGLKPEGVCLFAQYIDELCDSRRV